MDHVPPHAGHRADDAAPVGQVHVRIQRHRGHGVLSRGDEGGQRGGQRLQHGVGQLSGREGATRPFGVQAGRQICAAQLLLQHAFGDLPPLQPVEIDGDRIFEVPCPVPDADVEPVP